MTHISNVGPVIEEEMFKKVKEDDTSEKIVKFKTFEQNIVLKCHLHIRIVVQPSTCYTESKIGPFSLHYLTSRCKN